MKLKPKQLQITQGKLIQGTASGTAETAFTLPTSDGSDGQVLKTDGSGTVSWSNESGGGGGGGSPFSENVLPSASDTYDLGSSSAEWKDLYLGDDSVIYLGNDQDVQLKHSPDEGVILDMTSAGGYEPKFIMESNNTSNTGPTIYGKHQTTDPDPGDRVLRIWGTGRRIGSTNPQNYGAIDIISQNVTSSAPRGQITFLCQGSSNFQEGLRIYCDATATATPKVRISDAFDLPNADGNANQVLQTDGSGAVTWATVSSGSTDSISDSDGDTKIQVEESSDEDKIRFDTAGTERMIIADDGKVGIGTSTPSHALDISGDLRVRGNDIRDNSGNPAITMDGSAQVTIPNDLTLGNDLKLLSDSSKIYFGADSDVNLSHNHNDGFTLEMGGTNYSGDPKFIIYSTYTAGNGGSTLEMYHNSASPANNDVLGSLSARGKNSGGGAHMYGLLDLEIKDVTDGSEAGALQFYAATNGLSVTGASQSSCLGLTIRGNASGHLLTQIPLHDGANSGLMLGTTLVTSTAAELNKLDGATVTTAEINLLDGDTSVGSSSPIADGDGFIINDVSSGTTKLIPATDLKTYASSGGGASRPSVTEITSTPLTISSPASSVLELVYVCDSGAAVVTLPTAIGNEGLKVQVKNRIASAITVNAPNPGSQQTIDGSNSISIATQYESLTFISDNANWNII